MSNFSKLVTFSIITPDKKVFEEKISIVQIKLKDGYAGFNYNCFPAKYFCKFGILKIRINDSKTKNFLHNNGFLIVEKEKIIFYTEFCVEPENYQNSIYNKTLIDFLEKSSIEKKRQYYLNVQQTWLNLIKNL